MKNTTIMAIILSLILVGRVSAQSNIDPEHKWAWSENCGWTNWQHDTPDPGDGVFVTQTHLAGFAWGENIGWINLGDGTPTDGTHYTNETGEDFGVNMDPESRELFGMAWGENVGWINFEGGAVADPPNAARLEGCRFRGFVWGENIGWINLDDDVHFIQVEGIGCDDGDACTVNDLCTDGVCLGEPMDCSELDDQCNIGVCNSQTGECEPQPSNESEPCDDGNVCNVGETCQGGFCTGGGPPDCSGEGNQCEDASCDANGNEGNCDILKPVADGTECDDGQLCTKNDQCKGGACVGDEVVCPADLDGDCDVDAADLAQLLGDWGPCDRPCEPGDPATTCAADLSGDCEVEAFDLALLLGAWGSCFE